MIFKFYNRDAKFNLPIYLEPEIDEFVQKLAVEKNVERSQIVKMMSVAAKNKVMKLNIVLVCFFILLISFSVSGQLPDNDCLDRLIRYDIQQNAKISRFQVLLLDPVKDGNVKLQVYPMQVSGYRSPISDSAISALRRGDSLQKIYRTDKSVALLVIFERQVLRLPGVRSVSWTAEERCSPGFVCASTGITLPPSYVAPCLAYRASNKSRIRRSTTLEGAIKEALALLEKRQDRVLLENFLVSKSTQRISSVEISKNIKSFRNPTDERSSCPGISRAEHLEKALREAKSLKPKILNISELEQYNFSKSDQKFTWALIRFPSPVCEGGRIVMYFVQIGRFWYIRN